MRRAVMGLCYSKMRFKPSLKSYLMEKYTSCMVTWFMEIERRISLISIKKNQVFLSALMLPQEDLISKVLAGSSNGIYPAKSKNTSIELVVQQG